MTVSIYAHSLRNVKIGDGPRSSRQKLVENRPQHIRYQGFFILSLNQPHPGLNMPYMAESNRNIKPILPTLKSYWKTNFSTNSFVFQSENYLPQMRLQCRIKKAPCYGYHHYNNTCYYNRRNLQKTPKRTRFVVQIYFYLKKKTKEKRNSFKYFISLSTYFHLQVKGKN